MARFDSGARYDSGIRFDEPDPIPAPHSSMRNLSRFLENPFDDDGISEAELLAFSTDNLQRMTANSPVPLAARITATTAKFNIVAQCSSDDTVRLGARKAAKMMKDDFRASLKDAINGIWVVVVAKFGLHSPQEMEIFPKGRSVFQTSETTDDKLQVQLNALLAALTSHAVALGADVVDAATALKTDWMTIYEASEIASGQKTTTEAGKRTARENLQLELYYNLIELMKMFPRQPEKLALYMTQSLLEDHPAAPEEPEPPTP